MRNARCLQKPLVQISECNSLLAVTGILTNDKRALVLGDLFVHMVRVQAGWGDSYIHARAFSREFQVSR